MEKKGISPRTHPMCGVCVWVPKPHKLPGLALGAGAFLSIYRNPSPHAARPLHGARNSTE